MGTSKSHIFYKFTLNLKRIIFDDFNGLISKIVGRVGHETDFFKDEVEFAFSLMGFCGDRVGLDKDQEG